MELEFHEAANIFPIDEEHLDELAADIKANGQRLAVELVDGKIIDGRRRYTACKRIGVAPLTVKLDCIADPVAYVLSLNLHRRHLTDSQRSYIGAKAREIYDRQAKERQKASGGDRGNQHTGGKKLPVRDHGPQPANAPGKATEKAGAAVGVSGKSIERATKVLKQGIPELGKAVEAGEITVRRASAIADLPPEEQREEMEKTPEPKPRKVAKADADDAPETGRKPLGVGVTLGYEAINSLTRIPKNDALRADGFKLVTDWIRRNK